MRLKLLMILAAAVAAGCAAVPRGPATADLYVAATTDVHGRLRGWEYYTNAPDTLRGLTRAATIVDSLRAAHPGQVVLVDAGDLLQGNPLAYVAARVDTVSPHPVAAAMRAMHYDAAALGNHEFNYGLPTLQRAIGQAGFPFLAANAYRPDGSRAFPAYTIVDRGGVRVGIVGATTPGAMVWDRDNLRDRLVVRDIVPETRAAVAEARKAGAQVVVVAIHSGLHEPSSYDTVSTGVASENVTARVAHEVPGIDVIVYGHSHREVGDTVINGVRLVQPRNWAGSVGVVSLHLERTDRGWTVASSTGQVIGTRGHVESPAVLAATEQMHQATVRWATDSIGYTPVTWRADSARLQDTPLVDFILEVERRHTGADLASTAAFSLEASLPAGKVTAGSLAALYPYDNTLRVVRISGAQLRDYLEFSSRYYLPRADGTIAIDPKVPGYNFDIIAGADYTLDVSKPFGARVTRLTVKGKPVAATDTFTLALNNYRQTGGGGYAMLATAPLVYDRQEGIRELLIDEVRRRGTIRPDDYFQRNWELVRGGAAQAPARAAAPAGPTKGPRLRIISTNDFHGALEARRDPRWGLQGGAAYVASVIESARAACTAPDCVSILVDGGDLFQGTPVSNLSYGRPVLAWFNRMGYDAAALGNHEFDWGRDTLRALMRGAKFPILGANARYSNGRDVEWVKDDLLLKRGGRTIGIIGLASILTKRTTRAANTTGMEFPLPGRIVDSLAKRLRARGAEAIVVIAHDGAFCDATGARDCRGEIVDFANALSQPVDAIVAGHTHTLVNTTVRGMPIVQARSSGRAVAVIDVPLGAARAAGDTARHAVLAVGSDTLKADAGVAAMVSQAIARIAPRINRVVVTLPVALPRGRSDDEGQYPLGNLIADAQRWAGKGDIAVMNNGGIRAPLPAGKVTWGQLFEVQPFGNVLYAAEIPGKNLKAYFERLVGGASVRVHVSGVKLVVDTTRARGDRIVAITDPAGRPLDRTRSYRVIMNDFMATGGDNVGPSGLATNTRSLDVVDLDALVDYLRRQPAPLAIPREVRIEVGPAR